MQLKKIILYSRAGLQRELTFKQNSVNVISGNADTGKSAIISIIDYCFGITNAHIAGDVIRKNTSWFALLLLDKGEEVFIARKNSLYDIGNNSMIILTGQKVVIPDLKSSSAGFTYEHDVRNQLASRLGINLKEDSFSVDGRLQNISIETSRIYCFQAKTDIDQKEILFYQQRLFNIGKEGNEIKTTLPFFLNTINRNLIKLDKELVDLGDKIRKLEKEKRYVEKNISQQAENIINIFQKAKIFKLIDSNIDINTNTDSKATYNEKINTMLELLFEARFDNINENQIISNDEIENIQKEKEKLQIELQNHQDNFNIQQEQIERQDSILKEAEKKLSELSNFVTEVEIQHNRLKSVELYSDTLFSDTLNKICPFCESNYTIAPPPTKAELEASKKHVENIINIADSNDIRKELGDFINAKSKEIKKLNALQTNILGEITRTRQKIKLLNPAQKNTDDQKQRLIGELDLFKRFFSKITPFSEENQAILKSYELRRFDVIGLIKEESEINLLSTRIFSISTYMTNWAKELPFELQNSSSVLFDLDKLAVIFKREQEDQLALSRTTGEKNSVCTHLLIHFALHKVFIEEKSPVPNFLVLDKFLRVFDDNEKTQVIDFILKRSEELNLQVIILEKEELFRSNPLYKKLLVPEWEQLPLLIPKSWITQ